MATTRTCDVCGTVRPVLRSDRIDAWAGWVALQSPGLEHDTYDFCSVACLAAWLAART